MKATAGPTDLECGIPTQQAVFSDMEVRELPATLQSSRQATSPEVSGSTHRMEHMTCATLRALLRSVEDSISQGAGLDWRQTRHCLQREITLRDCSR
jgi:hypothetical protein